MRQGGAYQKKSKADNQTYRQKHNSFAQIDIENSQYNQDQQYKKVNNKKLNRNNSVIFNNDSNQFSNECNNKNVMAPQRRVLGDATNLYQNVNNHNYMNKQSNKLNEDVKNYFINENKNKNISKKYVCAPAPQLSNELKINNDETILHDNTEKNSTHMEVEDKISDVNNEDCDTNEKMTPDAELPKISHTTSDVVEDRGLKISEFVISVDELKTLLKREKYYVQPLHNFNLDNHKNIKWHMRAILLDWMMEVCAEFGLKRETFNLALNYTDRQLLSEPGLKEQELQLVGVTCLQIAAKFEEIYAPKAINFAGTTDGGYNDKQIRQYELKILTKLSFNVVIPTHNQWINIYMSEWDKFFNENPQQNINLFFREISKKSYTIYRELMQILDTAQLTTEIYRHNFKIVALSLLQLVTNKQYDNTYNFNDTFNKFLSGGINTSLNNLTYDDLLPCIKFMNNFMKLPLVFNQPKIRKIANEAVNQTASKPMYEELLAYHLYNNNSLAFTQNLKKHNAF